MQWILAVALLPYLATATPLDSRQSTPGIFCDGNQAFSEDDCRSLVDIIFGSSDPRPDVQNICTPANQNQAWTLGEGRNCRIEFRNYEDRETCEFDQTLAVRANQIISRCNSRFASGGYDVPNQDASRTQLHILANPCSGVGTPPGNPCPVRQQLANIEHDVLPSRNTSKHFDLPIKRQQPEDESFFISLTATNVNMPGGEVEIVNMLPGETFQITETESKSVGISASVTLGGEFFGLMTASAGLTVSEEYTVSNSVGRTFTNTCEGNGVLIWTPTYDFYEGSFQPSLEPGEFWVPQERTTATESYFIRCLGDI